MSLRELCKKMAGPFALEILLSILGDIGMGMQWVHSRNIMHRDLNLSNILIFEDFVVKVRVLWPIIILGW